MDAWRFILASLRHFRRVHLAVALGVAVATAVLTGALVVGDSMRGSLRGLTLQRLGRIDTVLVAGRPFREALARELAEGPEFQEYFAEAEPALLLNASLQAGSGSEARRATGVSLVGTSSRFWSLGDGGPEQPLAEDQVALTEAVARELGVKPGDDVLIRVPSASAIPADSTLGKKSEAYVSRTMKLVSVLPPTGLARFALAPSQQLPRTAFVTLKSMQRMLDLSQKVNAILIAARDVEPRGDAGQGALEAALQPTLADYGLKIDALPAPADALQLSADQLVLPEEAVRAAESVMNGPEVQRVVTYLANTISTGEGASLRKIPYSTVTGVDSTMSLGPLLDKEGQALRLADDEIVLNRWAADELGAKVGDSIRVSYYEPESTHGQLREHQPPPVFTLRAIAELETEAGEATLAADPRLTPELPGVTDQKSISDWDLPFELTEKIRPQDEDYWEKYRTTPKAFVSLATASRLWASRWGTTSLVRISGAHLTPDDAAAAIARGTRPAALGLTLLPVKREGLASATGTTPFEALFLGFSLFLIAAAVMLVSLLFRLGIQQRAAEIGTLGAVGLNRKRVTGLVAREGMLVAIGGAIVGVVGGVMYAWLMIYGLRTWWIEAISTPFLELDWTWRSLLLGGVMGAAVSWATVRWSIGRLVKRPARELMAGVMETPISSIARTESRPGVFAWTRWRVVLGALVVVLCGLGIYLRGERQAGAFFGSGAAMLVLLLGEVHYRLRNFRRGRGSGRTFSLRRLSMLNIARNPGRSTLTIGLVGAATFLIVAVSAFRLDTGADGTGGFEYLATSDLPIHFDLNSSAGRQELGFAEPVEKAVSRRRVFALRVADGEDASCLNLYQPKQPRVLGVPAALARRGGFIWSAVAEAFSDKPWQSLEADLGAEDSGGQVIPVVLDKSTAVYSLHLGGVGSRLVIRDAADRAVELEIVGLLENSVLQGNLLVSEENFLKLFPDVAGYRFFLIEPDAERSVESEEGQPGSLPSLLESALAEEGLDVVAAREQLAQFLAVQNTYLSTFQSLGGLGLLLGTIGLAVVQLRSVVERRGELALMRAGGFRPSRLVGMVIWENGVLLVGGLVIGVASAAIALVPQWVARAAGVPWGMLGLLLGTIGLVGLGAGWLATRTAVRAPIVPALRGD